MSQVLINGYVLIPNTPVYQTVRQMIRHVSGIQTAVTQSEERGAFTSKLRRAIDYRIQCMTPQDTANLAETIRAAQMNLLTVVPLWGRGSWITSIATAAITLTTLWAWNTGDTVFLLTPTGYYTRTVVSFTGGVLTVDSGGISDATMAIPMLFGIFTAAPQLDPDAPLAGAFSVAVEEAILPEASLTALSASPNLNQIYLRFFVSAEGGLTAQDLSDIQAAVNSFRNTLAAVFYTVTPADATHYIRFYNVADDHWLGWLGSKISTYPADSGDATERAAKYINFGFIGQANAYNATPRNKAAEPTSQFTTDYGAFNTEVARRTVSISQVMLVAPPASESSYIDERAALVDQLAGNSPYTHNLAGGSYKVVADALDIPNGRGAGFWLELIYETLESLGLF